MDCNSARSMLFRLLDDEVHPGERQGLDAHLRTCPSCAREQKILMFPRRLARSIPALEPSPFFYSRLKARLERESQSITIWQVMIGMSRQIVPALATVTLVIISLFAYLEYRGSGPDLYQAYDSIFVAADRSTRMVIAEEITDESVLHALAEKPANPAFSAPREKK
jgi:hypothetical protein